MTRHAAVRATIAIALVADVALFALSVYWAGELSAGLKIFLVALVPLTLTVAWPTYVLLR